ncbi:MAG: glycosyltransferase 87 family protein [Bacteroidota bacterium]
MPTLSDDGYRYIWDGVLVAQHGISPYSVVPRDLDLATNSLEGLFQNLNSPEYYSVYPPVSQAVFALGGLFYGFGWQVSWLAIKLVLVAAEGIGIVCLARLVSVRGVALYALHPIALIEVAGQGHTEGALVGLIGIALWSFSRRPGWAGVALAMAGWVKLFPLALAPLLGRRGAAWGGWGIGLIMGAAFLIPGNGLAHLLDSVRLYGGTLDFYAAPFLAVKALLYPIGGELAGRWAALALSCVWGSVLVWLFLTHDGTPASFRRGLGLSLVFYGLLSPMQHPWNWLGPLFVLPLLQQQLSLYWLITLSFITYLRYVGLETAYIGAIILGWGGAALLYVLRANPRGLDSLASR